MTIVVWIVLWSFGLNHLLSYVFRRSVFLSSVWSCCFSPSSLHTYLKATIFCFISPLIWLRVPNILIPLYSFLHLEQLLHLISISAYGSSSSPYSTTPLTFLSTRLASLPTFCYQSIYLQSFSPNHLSLSKISISFL